VLKVFAAAKAVLTGDPSMIYTIKFNGEVLAQTDWPPLAQAAWSRATRDYDNRRHGGSAELWKDNRLLARAEPGARDDHRWPDRDSPVCDLRDVLKALLQLLRDDSWDVKEIAEAMTDHGLPTTRSQIDALRGSSASRRRELIPAELVVLINAVLNQYKKATPRV
jgi:hypothetical protein